MSSKQISYTVMSKVDDHINKIRRELRNRDTVTSPFNINALTVIETKIKLYDWPERKQINIAFDNLFSNV